MTDPAMRPALARRAAGAVRPMWLLAVLTGAITGLAVAVYDRLAKGDLFDEIIRLPLAVQALAPLVGLTLAGLALRYMAAGASPSTADEYIKNFHERDRRLSLRPLLGRVVASAATLGSGCAMGFEGPSIYIGAATGSALQHRFSRFFTRDEAKVLLVAGAAAGVAAIFKAPATGAVFALEVPYRDDLARRMLLPALFSAAAGYVVFVAINGTTPLFPVGGAPPFDLRDLGGAALIGLVCGFGARGFAWLIRLAKQTAQRGHPAVRAGAAGGIIAVLVLLGHQASGDTLVLGSGYRTITWALEPGHAVLAIVAIFLLRALATGAATVGGGAGGLFVPLVVQGALVGTVAGSLFGNHDPTLFPLLGVAAFLAAGYRVPLAAVMFVAETTGKPGFVVPALIAAAVSQVAVGRWSVSSYQQAGRAGHLERRLTMPLTSALRTDAATVPPDATVAEFFAHHVLELHLTTVPVIDHNIYVGMIDLGDLGDLDRQQWNQVTVGSVTRRDAPVAHLSWTLGQALSAMEAGDTDRLPVIDDDRYIGIITTGEILKLDEVLDRTEIPPP